MADIQTTWDPLNGRGDWTFSAPDLVSGGDLVNAVLISLFTDRTAQADDTIPDGTTDPRGWWGDLGASRPIGSRLWLLMRAKASDKTLALARNMITEALRWLIDDGVVARIDVVVEWTRPSLLGAEITLFQRDGTRAFSTKYNWAWAGVS
ncbi:MAG: phage GP46 family protein [Caulobacteraceae bacterium]|nr:phage GP46 family protein [Caulobacteraceae bacterium]